MKKFIAAHMVWLAVTGALIGSVRYQSEGLANVGQLAMWLLILLLMLGALLVVGAIQRTNGEGCDEKKNEWINTMREGCKPDPMPVWETLRSMSLAFAAAYAGFFGAAMTFAIAYAIYRVELGRA